MSFVNEELGTAVLVGRDDKIRKRAEAAGIDIDRPGIELINARLSARIEDYANNLYRRLQRKGYLYRDCLRMVNSDRNIFCRLDCRHG